jgi:hypothetical protein
MILKYPREAMRSVACRAKVMAWQHTVRSRCADHFLSSAGASLSIGETEERERTEKD